MGDGRPAIKPSAYLKTKGDESTSPAPFGKAALTDGWRAHGNIPDIAVSVLDGGADGHEDRP